MRLKLSQLRSVLAPWCITTAQFHSTKPELRFCTDSSPACSVSEIHDGEDLWLWSRLEIRQNAFRRSTIPQKQLIIIINVNFPYPLETSENHRFFMFSGGIKGNIDPKWVKQLQYQRERHNLILFAWNASGSLVKQNDCKNKTTWLTQTALSKSFSLFHTTYIEDIKEFFKGLFFRSKLVLY